MSKYDGRMNAIEKRIPRKRQTVDTRIWIYMPDGTHHSRGEILTDEEFNARYPASEVIKLWFSEDDGE